MATRRCAATLEGHSGDLFALRFSPDGSLLASGSRDDEIKLWDVEARRCLITLEGHERSVFTMDFSPDGRTLASGSSDHTVYLWDLTHYDRHIAGNLEYQLARLQSAGVDPAAPGLASLRAWARRSSPGRTP